MEILYISEEKKNNKLKCLNISHGGSGGNTYILFDEDKLNKIKLKISKRVKEVKKNKIYKKCKLYNNGKEQRYFDNPPDDPSWQLGSYKKQTENHKRKLSEARKLLKYYNNGIIEIRRKEHPGVGWNEGRLKVSEKTKELLSKKCKGFKWYNNGITEIKIFNNENIPDNFKKGRLKSVYNDEMKNKISKSNLNRKWYNNGKISIHISNLDIVPEGFISGMLITENMRERSKLKWFNNNEVEIMCKIEDVPEGFVRGRLKRKNK